jgi:potassium efflux system protein
MPFVRLWRVLILSVLLAVALASVVSAQGVGNTGNPLIEQQRGAIQQYAAKADELEKNLAADADHDGKLVEIRLQLEQLARDLLASAVAFRPRLSEINARLDQLGPAPADGQQEIDIVAAERAGLLAEKKGEINAVLGLAESLSIRVNGLVEKIGLMRSELFRNVLTKRYSLVDAFDGELLDDVHREYVGFYRAVSSWFTFVFQYKFQSVLAAAFFALIAAAVLLLGGRRVFSRLIHPDPAAEDPSYLHRLSVAFWSTLMPTAAVGVFLLATLFFFDYFKVLRGDIGVYLNSLFSVIGVVFAVNRLANAVLSPRMPNWRLIAISSGTGYRLVAIITAMAVVIGVNNFLTVVNNTMGSPLSLTIARSFLSAIVVGSLLIFIGLLRDRENWAPWRAWLRSIAIVLGGTIILLALLGYIGLANFISAQVVVTGTVLITAYIGFLSARAIGAEGGFAETSVGRWLSSRPNVDPTTLDQLGLVVSLAINLMVLLIFLPAILLLWGFQLGDIQAWAYRLAGGFSIGSFRFSPAGILSGIVVFIIGYFLTRWFQAWLDGSVMARGRLDTGVRNSIRTVVGYAGLAVAALIAVSSAGIDLSSFALIAGGLSLGIGFGLQNIVSNFVSGLILLVERPFKAGDWIVAGDVSGTVKKISVRATEIETFQRQSVILPNSQFINSAVGNWTHRNKLGRVDIKVSIAYDSDARRTFEVLQDVARSHPLVLRNPEPFVAFANFGAAGMEFELRVFLADILNGGTVQNDIRFAILDVFAAEGIEIPSTPRAEVKKSDARWPTDEERDEAYLLEQKALAEETAAAQKTRRRGARRKPDPS